MSGGVVYDSSAHAFISASSQYESADEPPGGERGKGGKALWSAPGEYEYHFTLHPLDSREMHPAPSRMRVKFVVEMQLSEREMLSEPVPVTTTVTTTTAGVPRDRYNEHVAAAARARAAHGAVRRRGALGVCLVPLGQAGRVAVRQTEATLFCRMAATTGSAAGGHATPHFSSHAASAATCIITEPAALVWKQNDVA